MPRVSVVVDPAPIPAEVTTEAELDKEANV